MADKTFVFELNLDENENNNEFSYLELVKDKLGGRAPSDPFGEDDTSELMEIARQFERKYGDMVTVNKKGRKRNLRVADYRDLGAGYDSGDSFIDDSEYVELVVPPTVRTRFEGFFINTGTLEMLEDKSIDIEAPPPPKQPKLDIPANKRPAVKKDKSKQLLERAVKQLSVPNAVASTAAKPSMTNGVSGVTSSLDAVFDSVISAGTSADNLITPSPSFTQPQPPVPTISQSTPSAPPTLPPLPDDLNAEVLKFLAMKSTSQGGTAKSLFTPQIEEALLRFDELLVQKNLKKATRSGTYAYMAAKLGIKSKTLLARLRKLKDAQNGASLDPILDRLRSAVKSAMVDVKTSYERDMGYYQTRLSAWEREKLTNPEAKRPGVPKKKFPFNALCKSYLEAVVSHHMESVFRETKTYPDQDKMKTFFVSLTSIWPEGWISVKALMNASKSVFERINNKAKSNGCAASSASEVVNTGGSSLPELTPSVSSILTPPKLPPPVSAAPVSPAVRSSPSVAGAMRAASVVQSGVAAVELSSTKSTTNSSPYVLQFASSTTSAGPRKETPKVTVPQFIDLTEMNSSSVGSNCGKQQHLTSSTGSAAPVSKSMNFSPPSITTSSKSGISKPASGVPANSAGSQRRIVLNASPSTTSMVSSSTVLNRPQMPSVTVPVAQFLGRNASGSPVATTVSSQQQQQTATLQTVTNIISAYQANFQKQHAQTQVMTNMQKQGQSIVNLQKHQGQTGVLKQEEKPSSIIQTQTNTQKLEQQVQQTQRQQTQQQQRVTTCPENVRFATQVPSIIINRSHQQQLQATHTAQINAQTAGQQASINVSNNTRVAHSTAVLSRPQRGAWGNQVSHSPGSNTALLTNSLPTAQIIRPQSTQQRPLPHQQQQQMQAHSQQSAPQAQFQQFQQQQQFRAAVAGMVSRNPLDYISWTRQFSTSQDQSNEAHRNSDRSSGK